MVFLLLLKSHGHEFGSLLRIEIYLWVCAHYVRVYNKLILKPTGQVYSQSSWSRDIRWTKEGPSWDDDSYLGYSVAHGEFSGDNESDVAVGMPRGANLTGKVGSYYMFTFLKGALCFFELIRLNFTCG